MTRSWNGHPIQRRRVDGYVNGTAMCQVAGKHWKNYAQLLRSAEYIKALEGSAEIPADLLAQSVVTGPNHGRGTWVHPRLAVDLARWISPEFAVWMDGWILEELEAKASPALPPSALTQEDITEMLALVCADISEQARRLASMAGWPTFTSLMEAQNCFGLVRRRMATVERLLPTVEPLDRKPRHVAR